MVKDSKRLNLYLLAFAVFLLVPSFDTVLRYFGLIGIAVYFVVGTLIVFLTGTLISSNFINSFLNAVVSCLPH
jgi:hypothetical protein